MGNFLLLLRIRAEKKVAIVPTSPLGEIVESRVALALNDDIESRCSRAGIFSIDRNKLDVSVKQNG